MKKMPKIKPYINVGAGDIIKRNLDSLGWSQEDLSQITEISGKTISQIINNKQRVTVETAVLLSNVFGTSPEYWLNLDNNYRLNLQEEDSREKSTKTKAEIRKYMPVLEISKKGWFSSDNSALGYEKIYNEIWNTNSVDFSVYEKLEPSYCARQSKENEEYTRLYSLTWYQIARTFSRGVSVPQYDKKKLLNLSKRLTDYTIIKDGVSKIIKDLNAVGVYFLNCEPEPDVSSTYISIIQRSKTFIYNCNIGLVFSMFDTKFIYKRFRTFSLSFTNTTAFKAASSFLKSFIERICFFSSSERLYFNSS